MKTKICVVTGSRAEYGLLHWVMKGIEEESNLELQIVATGMHLSPEYGLTYKQIETDGFKVDEKVEMLVSSDTAIGIAKSIGLGVIGFSETFQRLQPDLILVLGDRYEILAAVQAALVAKIPVGHIAGGDITEGAYDDSIRHSITKMSHLHFVTNEQAFRRVKQLGENPSLIYNVGSPGLDHLNKVELLSREELEKSLDFKLREKNFLVTFHPVTLEQLPAAEQFEELLNALSTFKEEVGIIFTKPNSDNDSRELIRMIDEYVKRNPNTKAFTSLGQLRYLSAIKHCDLVIGNSSSGLYEVPSFGKPTINIGDRQKGRLQATSIINCKTEKDDIVSAIQQGFKLDCSNATNPYGDGHSSKRIIEILKSFIDFKKLLKKRFYEENA